MGTILGAQVALVVGAGDLLIFVIVLLLLDLKAFVVVLLLKLRDVVTRRVTTYLPLG